MLKCRFFTLTAICLLLSAATLLAQEPGSNIFKLNLGALPLKNISVQYEHILSKKFSVALGGRYMPKTDLPFNDLLENVFFTDDETYRQISPMRLMNYAITPEFRYYFGKGYGRGFYIAPFARYAYHKGSTIFSYDVDYTLNGIRYQFTDYIPAEGNFTTITGGIMIGAQWKLTKLLYLDWWIIGPQYGGVTGHFFGYHPLSPEQQQAAKEEADQLDIPFMNIKNEVNSNGIKIDLSGPWAGIRAGLCIGLRF
jgi:hypothetical protein